MSDFNLTDFATGATIAERDNATVSRSPLNASNVHEFQNSTIFSSSTEASTNATYFVADTNTTTSSYDGAATFHNISSSSMVEIESVSSTIFPVINEQNSSKVSLLITSESSRLETTTFALDSTTRYFGNDAEVHQSSMVGIAVGVTVAVVVLLLAVFIVLFVVFRRKRSLRRKKSEVVMENPQYSSARDSTLPKNFDLTMHTGPMVRSHLNNNSAENLTSTNGKRKKDAPRPPIYKPTSGKDSASKRKAPAPPKFPGYEDLYEKDSAAGSTEALELTSFYAVDNHNIDPIAADNEERSRSKPLLESFHPQKKSPKRSSRIESDKTIEADTNDDKDEDRAEDEEMKTALLGKDKAASTLSLDSYDKEKNPFFSG